MKVRIVVDFEDNYPPEDAKGQASDVHQLFMRRNPLEEPWIHVDVSDDGGKNWRVIE